MNIAINDKKHSLSDELLSILHLAESKHGSFNDFVFLEKPHQRNTPDEKDSFLTARTIRIEGDEVVKGYALWDTRTFEPQNNTTECKVESWTNVSPHIIGLEWYNRNSPDDMAQVIDKIYATL